MTIPAVWPRPGVRGRTLWHALQAILNGTTDVSPNPGDPVPRYVRWANAACQQLAPLLPRADVDGLVRTPAYWTALALPSGAPHGLQLVNAELDERRTDLQEVIASLEAFDRRYTPDRPTTHVVADTNAVLEHPGGLAGVDWPTVLERYMRPFDDVRVVIPLGVVDELDDLKRVHRTKDSARHALKAIYGYFGTSIAGRPAIWPGDVDDGQVSVELLMDAPGHVRLPHMDDELIRVAERLSAFTPNPPVFLTYDTGAAFRATAADLPHVRLARDFHAGP